MLFATNQSLVPIYTPIIIRYVPAVVVDNDSSLVKVEDTISIRIEPPQGSVIPGINQSISRPFILPIPASGLLKLKLIASNQFTCGGEYVVSFFERNNRSPLDKQRWNVPFIQNSLVSVEVVHNSLLGGTILPKGEGQPVVFELVSTSLGSGFTFDPQTYQVLWETPPPDNTIVTIIYQAAVTLDDVIVKDHSHSPNHSNIFEGIYPRSFIPAPIALY